MLLFAPGFRADGDRFDLTVDMLRWTFPYILFVSLAALAGGVLNSYGRFAVPATTSTLMNLVMIVFAAFIAPHFDQPGVDARDRRVRGRPGAARRSSCRSCSSSGCCGGRAGTGGTRACASIGRLMLPAIFGSSVSQVALLLDTLIASFLATGSIAWLYYADRLVEFPLGVFSIALATVILPGLAAHHAAQSPERFASTLDWAIKLTTIVVLPATVALLLLAGPLTVVIFHYGAFDEQDVRMSTLALMAYSIGLMGFSMVKVLAPGYFARQDTRTPGADRHPARCCSSISLNLVDRAAARVPVPGQAGPARAAGAEHRHRRVVQRDDAVPGPAPPARAAPFGRAGGARCGRCSPATC